MEPAAGERLRGTWRAAFDRPLRGAWRPVALAAAASLAFAALAGWWLLRTDPNRGLATGPAAAAVQPVVLLNRIPRGETRAPTPLERLLVTPPRNAARAP